MSAAIVVSALALGFVGSTHCIAMCGGIAAALGGRPLRAATYNLGRVLSYSAFGALAGGLGAMTSALPFVRDAQLGLRVLAAAMLLGAGLWLAGFFGAFSTLERVGVPLWRRVSRLAARLTASEHTLAGLGLGLLWGMMPCGLVYAALALAATSGGATDGALTMAAFGAGTAPLLLLLGVFATGARRLARGAWARRLAGVVLCVSAVVQLHGAHALASSAPSEGAPCCHGHR